MRHKSNFIYGNWYVSSDKRSESSRRVYKEYATTSSKRREMEQLAIKRMLDDIYFLALTIGRRMHSRESNCAEEVKEINNLIISEHGRKNIVYDPIGHPEERLPKPFDKLESGIFITPEGHRKGIPVWEFIKWYTLWDEEGESKIASAIEEWSGIPAYLHKATYDALINNYLLPRVKEEHAAEDKYSRRNMFSHGEIYVTIIQPRRHI